MLSVFARQCWVYSVLTAKDTKMVCWVCRVEDITEECRGESGRDHSVKMVGTVGVTLWSSLRLHGSGGQLMLDLLVRVFNKRKIQKTRVLVPLQPLLYLSCHARKESTQRSSLNPIVTCALRVRYNAP